MKYLILVLFLVPSTLSSGTQSRGFAYNADAYDACMDSSYDLDCEGVETWADYEALYSEAEAKFK